MHFTLLLGDLQWMASAAWIWLGSAWESFARSAGGTLVTSLWQGALIACTLEIAMRLTPRVSASHRFAAWAVGFGLATALPLLPLLSLLHNSAVVSPHASELAGASSGALFQLDLRWGLAIAGLWLAASIVRATSLAVHSVSLRRLWSSARPIEVPDRLSSAIRDLRGGRVAICTITSLDRPSVIGFLAPRILIPEWLLARVTPDELEQIVLHEAEHLRRGDDWINLLQKLCLVVFPINPALAWMEHHLCREREMACDEGVVRITNAPRAYAACLASLAERGLERRAEALSLGAWHRRSELVHRVHRILLRKPGMSRTAAGALLSVLGCTLIAGSVEMARCPQLVAFVTKPNNLTMTPERQQQLATLLAQEDADAKIMLPPSFHAIPAKAVIPAATKSAPSNPHKHVARDASKAVHDTSDSLHAMQIAKANQSGDHVDQEHTQQWVVLAAWEEVQTVSRLPKPVADYDNIADAPGATTQEGASPASRINSGNGMSGGPLQSGAAPTPGGTASQYTITRLILRVVPANPNSTSTQPPAASIRGGWLVFQL